jgi:hypothetical protein
MAALRWTLGNQTPVEASCGDPNGCGGINPNWPAGTTPMPWPTADLRGSTALSWISPDKDEFLIQIWPYRQDTRVSIDITLKNPAHAGLPADVSLYKGRVIQSLESGFVSYQAPAAMEVVAKFYESVMASAGWQKGALEVNIIVTLSCTGCVAL